jgi:hypothetical protein
MLFYFEHQQQRNPGFEDFDFVPKRFIDLPKEERRAQRCVHVKLTINKPTQSFGISQPNSSTEVSMGVL